MILDIINVETIILTYGPPIFLLWLMLDLILFYLRRKRTDERLLEAEQKAFGGAHAEKKEGLAINSSSQEGLDIKGKRSLQLIESSKSPISIANLFNLYSKQIEKYQQETRLRASLSFGFAILSMFAGLAFIFWGGTVILRTSGWENTVAGSAISTIGGAISAYITKTFLDVHKLSLNQLNRYFKQPVLNDHIIMAQRLADDLQNENAKQKAYELIISSVAKLIVENSDNLSENKSSVNSLSKE